MRIHVSDLIGKSARAEEYVELKKQVRQLPEPDRYALVQECLENGLADWALILTKSCLESRDYIVAVFDYGLRSADASSIKFWLECAVAKLGGRRVVQVVAAHLETNPGGVAKAIYWLPSLLPRDEPRTVAAYDELKRLADERGLIRAPKILPDPNAPERVLFGNVWAEGDT